MAVSLRKAEVEAVVAILEEEHDSARDLAKLLLKTIYKMVEDREWWSVHHRPWPDDPRPVTFSFGPFATKAEAVKAFQKMDGGTGALIPLLSVTSLTSRTVTD